MLESGSDERTTHAGCPPPTHPSQTLTMGMAASREVVEEMRERSVCNTGSKTVASSSVVPLARAISARRKSLDRDYGRERVSVRRGGEGAGAGGEEEQGMERTGLPAGAARRSTRRSMLASSLQREGEDQRDHMSFAEGLA